MELSIADELNRAFDLAALRQEAKAIRSGHQWRKLIDLEVRCQEARRREHRLYIERYDTRVEVTRRRLVDEAGQKSWNLKPAWAAQDRFNAAATLRQAERQVRAAHDQRMGRIDEFQRRELKSLIEQSMRENNLLGMAREEFGRAVNRRSGMERRGGWVRRPNH
ncbi:MAG: hypothetical protein AB7P20_03050 [Rhizobiaceae bacterium]